VQHPHDRAHRLNGRRQVRRTGTLRHAVTLRRPPCRCCVVHPLCVLVRRHVEAEAVASSA
jgi:hypothetical protein